jgi:hypothetical protein
VEGMTDAQAAVMQPPFHPRMNRSSVDIDSSGECVRTLPARTERPPFPCSYLCPSALGIDDFVPFCDFERTTELGTEPDALTHACPKWRSFPVSIDASRRHPVKHLRSSSTRESLGNGTFKGV